LNIFQPAPPDSTPVAGDADELLLTPGSRIRARTATTLWAGTGPDAAALAPIYAGQEVEAISGDIIELGTSDWLLVKLPNTALVGWVRWKDLDPSSIEPPSRDTFAVFDPVRLRPLGAQGPG
jgi:hypothetical protein